MADIVDLDASYLETAAPLFADFRVHLRSFKNQFVEPYLNEGGEEF